MTMSITRPNTTAKTTKKTPLLLDVDGVLLNWNAGFKTWMAQRGHIEICTIEYDMAKRYGMTDQKILELIEEFNRSAAVAFLFSMPGSVLVISHLRELGYEPVCITSFGGDMYSQIQRQNLLNHLFQVDSINIHILDTAADKRAVLSKWKDTGYFWVEDKLSNALLGHELGLKAILLRSDHTIDYVSDEIFVADSWWQIHQYITGEHKCQTNGSSSTSQLQQSMVS
jgi:hypothetical protein